jgi:hypothetical protein
MMPGRLTFDVLGCCSELKMSIAFTLFEACIMAPDPLRKKEKSAQEIARDMEGA